MRHFHRTHIVPAQVIAAADEFFSKLDMKVSASGLRSRTFFSALGTVKVSARPEGGHYTFIEAVTDQIGESRLDKNVKKFFVQIHRAADPSHTLHAGY